MNGLAVAPIPRFHTSRASLLYLDMICTMHTHDSTTISWCIRASRIERWESCAIAAVVFGSVSGGARWPACASPAVVPLASKTSWLLTSAARGCRSSERAWRPRYSAYTHTNTRFSILPFTIVQHARQLRVALPPHSPCWPVFLVSGSRWLHHC